MTCQDLRRWLDEGRPGAGAAALEAHAAGCPACRRELAAALALEAMLRAPPTGRAPAGFADAVLAQVRGEARAEARVEPAAAPLPVPPLPAPGPLRWLPLVAGGIAALAAAGLVVRAATPRLLALAQALNEAAERAAPPAHLAIRLQAFGAAVERWVVAGTSLPPPALAGASLVLAALAGGLGWALWRASEALVLRRA